MTVQYALTKYFFYSTNLYGYSIQEEVIVTSWTSLVAKFFSLPTVIVQTGSVPVANLLALLRKLYSTASSVIVSLVLFSPI
jgi:hypothetical protein